MAGVFLYWGEGLKTANSSLYLSNTDPSIIKFFALWLMKSLKVPKQKFHVQLHLYSDMDINKEISFWSEVIGVPTTQFIKPYIKNTFSYNINHKGRFGHGTCTLGIGNARLSEKILMAIKAISEKYGPVVQRLEQLSYKQ